MAYTNPNQIGEITEVTGVAKIIRTNGTEETVTLGTEIFQGDIVETAEGGAVNIGFIDDSSFAVSNDARIAIDEFVFDPETEGGVQDFSVMKGVFMYTSGLIGRENPDQVDIDTPVGSIGIRGTIIGGNINPEGDSQVSVIEGAIVVRNDGGEQLLTNQYETVTLLSRDIAPSDVKQMDIARIARDYGAVKDVSPTLFSSFNDEIAQDNIQNQDSLDNVEDKAVDATEEKPTNEVEVDANSTEDVILEETAPEAETLEETKLEIKALDDIPELKTLLDIHSDNKADLSKGHLDTLRDRLKDSNREEIDNIDIELLPQKIGFVSGGSIDENTTNGSTIIGTVALSNATNVTYSLIGPNAADYTLDSITGLLTYVGENSGDFENGDVLNVGIRAIDNDTGRIINQGLRISLDDLNEAPEVKLALEDVYDVRVLNDTTGDVGVLALNTYGARIGRLVVQDPEEHSFVKTDFKITGNVTGNFTSSTYFDIVEDNGQFYLELKADYKMIDGDGSVKIFDNNLGAHIPELSITLPTINIGVEISDGSLNKTESIKVKIANVKSVTGTDIVNLTAIDDVVVGDASSNRIGVSDDDFVFINGGDGYDHLYLKAQADSNEYNLTGDGLNDSLSSIEQIYFSGSDTDDILKIDIDSIIHLLKTSNHSYQGNGGELAISTNSSATNVNGINIVQNDGVSSTNLTSNGFVHNGTETRGIGKSWESDYEIYHHNIHGTVAIESDIAGAGGL